MMYRLIAYVLGWSMAAIAVDTTWGIEVAALFSVTTCVGCLAVIACLSRRSPSVPPPDDPAVQLPAP